ncbi:MAG: dihydrofolate reductase family protein [Ghiorsea sp.]
MKVSVYIATSLDGFIAREDGALDWLPGSDGSIDPLLKDEDFGYQNFMDSVDTLVMGRNTFELVISSGFWPYVDKHVIVLSSSLTKLPSRLPASVSLKKCSPKTIYEGLKKIGANHIYVDGGKTIQSFLNTGLVDEVTITTVPILIGTGIPLFSKLQNDIKLQHIETKTFTNGFVQNKYQLKN